MIATQPFGNTGHQNTQALFGWMMAQGNLFLNTVGDIRELPKFLEALGRYKGPPSDREMLRVVKEQDKQLLFV